MTDHNSIPVNDFNDTMWNKLNALTDKTSRELFNDVEVVKSELDNLRAERRAALDNKDLEGARFLQDAIEIKQWQFISINDQWFAAWKRETRY